MFDSAVKFLEKTLDAERYFRRFEEPAKVASLFREAAYRMEAGS